jgi:alkylation response protein AidB-like acyl-CoA dehydrogenase
MDLELSDEQRWLSESVEALLSRGWRPVDGEPLGDAAERSALWRALAEFGALAVGGPDGLGAIELSLIARATGAHLAPVPYPGGAALRFALGEDAAAVGDDAVALALLEPGGGWRLDAPEVTLHGPVLSGRKVAVEHAQDAAWLAVSAAGAAGPALALVDAHAAGVVSAEQPAFDPSAPMHAVAFEDAEATVIGDADALARLSAIGALLAAAEAVGAAGRLLDLACAYAAERRQFGRPIGSFQALRHLLADMYVKQASAWSSVLYASAALDERAEEAARTAWIAKAYVSRAAREVAHGAIQVFGGIAITAEHPAHRFLRRIVVREQQFGDSAFHERARGQALAASVAREPVGGVR